MKNYDCEGVCAGNLHSFRVIANLPNVNDDFLAFLQLSTLKVFNDYSCMFEMTPSIRRLPAHNIHASSKERIETLMRIFLILLPVTLKKCFQLGEKLFNWIKVR